MLNMLAWWGGPKALNYNALCPISMSFAQGSTVKLAIDMQVWLDFDFSTIISLGKKTGLGLGKGHGLG